MSRKVDALKALLKKFGGSCEYDSIDEILEAMGECEFNGGSGGGGVMRVNVSAEGLSDDMIFTNPTADKTYEEIMSFIESGGFTFATIDVTGSTMVIPLLQIDPEQDNIIIFGLTTMGTEFTVVVQPDNTVVGLIAVAE